MMEILPKYIFVIPEITYVESNKWNYLYSITLAISMVLQQQYNNRDLNKH